MCVTDNKANSILNRSRFITNPETFALVFISLNKAVYGFCQRDTVTGDVKTFGEMCAIIPLCIRNLPFWKALHQYTMVIMAYDVIHNGAENAEGRRRRLKKAHPSSYRTPKIMMCVFLRRTQQGRIMP